MRVESLQTYRLRKDGTTAYISLTISPIFDKNGDVIGASTIAHDVTQNVTLQRRLQTALLREQSARIKLESLTADLENRVAVRTAELKAVNRDLEMFARSVSHDLRAPLRAISAYAQVLTKEHSGTLENDGVVYLRKVIDNVDRANSLFDALLSFSQLGSVELRRRRLDIESLFREEAEIRKAGADNPATEVRVSPLPWCVADPVLVRDVVGNLLDNAMKFSRYVAAPLIEVSGRIEGETAEYCVEDNGAGFDMARAGELFSVFQRLHSQQEFEGNGVGLANVSRIIRRHGGSVRAEGSIGRGARFYFTLPAVSANMDDAQAPTSDSSPDGRNA